MMIPNFLVIGDLKAGSTSLHYYLKQHPGVYMPTGLKELRYFAYDEDNPYHVRAESYRVRSYSDYLRYFEECTGENAIGEVSPNYLRSPVAASKIRDKLPNVKLVVCLRNPADRLHSLYLMRFRVGLTKKPLDEQLFGEDATWIKGNYYWQDLKRYFDIFDEHQIKVIIFDELKANASSIATQLYGFLNVDDTFSPDLAIKNRGGLPRNKYWYQFMIGNKNYIKKFGSPPNWLRQVWSGMKNRSLQDIKLDPQIRNKILEICKDDILRTQELIKRDLTIWFE